jgi:hypothetical protein
MSTRSIKSGRRHSNDLGRLRALTLTYDLGLALIVSGRAFRRLRDMPRPAF